MNFNILKSIYRYREEMIVKLAEFTISIGKQSTNFHISNSLLQIIEFIRQNENKLKKKEFQLIEDLIFNTQNQALCKKDQKIYKTIAIQILKYYQKINLQFDQYISEKNFQNLILFKKYSQKNHQLKMNQEFKVVVETQRTFLNDILDHLKSLLIRHTNNLFDSCTLEFAKSINQFVTVLQDHYVNLKKNLEFQLQNKREKIQSAYIHFKQINNPLKNVCPHSISILDMAPLTKYRSLLFDRMMQKNHKISIIQDNFFLDYKDYREVNEILIPTEQTNNTKPWEFLKIIILEEHYSQSRERDHKFLNLMDQRLENLMKNKSIKNSLLEPKSLQDIPLISFKSPKKSMENIEEGRLILPSIQRLPSLQTQFYSEKKYNNKKIFQNMTALDKHINQSSPFILQ